MSPRGGTTERAARNAFLKAAVQATRLFSLTFVVLAARSLGPESFGKFTFAYALATLLGAALDLGMHSLLVREVARAPAETATLWEAAVTLKLTLLAPAGLVFAAIPVLTHRPSDTTAAVWLLGAAIALQSFIEIAVSILTGFERLEFELGLRLGEKVVLFAVGVTGLVLGGGLLLVCGTFVAAAAGSLALATSLIHRRFARLAWAWRPERARVLARTLGPVAGAFVLAFATTRLVPLLVALLAGDTAAGYLGAALRVVDVVMVIPVALIAAVYPVLSRTPAADPRFREAATQTAEMLLLLGLPIALALAYGAAWLIRWVFGAPYGPAAPLLAILGAAAPLAFLNYFFGFVLLALDRPGRLLGLAGASLVASVIVTPGLVRTFGAAGGAAALVLVEGATLVGALVSLVPLIGPPLGRGALKVGGAAAAAALVAAGLPPGGGRLAALAVVYAAGIVALGPVPTARWRRLLRGAVWTGG